MSSPEQESPRPASFIWLTAIASLMLPVLGVLTAIIGVFEVGRGHTGGWYWIGSGIFLIIADMSVDWVWGRGKFAKSQERDLSRRGAELIGQFVTVVDPIKGGGRGSVQAADTVWAVEGGNVAAGSRVKVTGIKGTVLIVERA